MTTKTIKLNSGEWSYNEAEPLGPPGGFGEVFRGEGPSGPVAVKRLKITASAAAHREMNIGAELAARDLDHVVPILDHGQDAQTDRYYLVMPVCERSLQEEINSKGSLPLEEARLIVLDILAGLREVGDIVHRDLKPGNVLFLDGRWRIADFGIAKFVEDSTSLETLRESLTPAYAAPEQWRVQKPTHATDVYALGCIMFSMLSGSPPFSGSQDQLREAHLHKAPPVLEDAGTRLQSFVQQMLRKVPPSRPTLERCVSVFEQAKSDIAAHVHPGLAAAASAVAANAAAAEAARLETEAREEEWAAIIKEAKGELEAIVDRLFSTITDFSDEADRRGNGLQFGEAQLVVQEIKRIHRGPGGPNLDACQWAAAAFTEMHVRTPRYVWSSSLVFAAIPGDEGFRWREVAFWTWSSKGGHEPFAIEPTSRDFQFALSTHITHAVNVAFGPRAIDGEDEQDFQRRWITLLTRGAIGKLVQPNGMPVPDSYFD